MLRAFHVQVREQLPIVLGAQLASRTKRYNATLSLPSALQLEGGHYQAPGA